MVYKRDKNSALEWKKFQSNFASLLIELGVPSSIVTSESRWWYLLEHGDELQSAWNPSQLDNPRARKLIKFLREKYPNNEADCLIQELKNVLS